MENIEDVTKLIRDSIKDFPKRYKQNEIDIKKVDLETQDLLHVIELGKIDAILRQELFKDLRNVRQARRKLKEENELLAPVVFTLDSIKNKLPQLDQGLGEIRKIKLAHGNRRYGFRVRHDLEKILNGRS